MKTTLTLPDDLYPRILLATAKVLTQQPDETDDELLQRSALLHFENQTKKVEIEADIEVAKIEAKEAEANVRVVENLATNKANNEVDFAPKIDTEILGK